MFSVTMLIRCAAILAVAARAAARADASFDRSDHGSCDAGEIAAALTTLPSTLTGQDLFSLCVSRFSQGICFVAGQTLRAQLSDRAPGDISKEQFAASACSAVEAAKNSQQALLQRQEQMSGPAEMGQSAMTSARAAELAAIRSSPQAHALSMSVAEHYRNGDAEDDSEELSTKHPKPQHLDDVLHRKSFSFPHNSFAWEQNHTTHPSWVLQGKVEKWLQDHAIQIDVSRPDIKYRTNFFKKFSVGNENYDVVEAGDEGKVKVDVSTLEDGSRQVEGPLRDDGSRSWFAASDLEGGGKNTKEISKESVPKQAPSGSDVITENVQMTALGTIKEAQALRKPVTKNFLASHKELNNLLSQVIGKGTVEVSK